MKILYEDVTIVILSRLPVKSLIRFKCICKFWYTLINSPSFISRHLKNYNDDNARLFVEYHRFGFRGRRFALFSDETLTDSSSYQVFQPRISKDHDDWSPAIYGPYKGLFCIYTPSCIDLWNPATRELRPLPKCDIELIDILEIGIEEVVYNVGIGFELDPVSNDYKMILIFELWNNRSNETGSYLHSHIALYTLSTDSWRYSKIDDLSSRYCRLDITMGVDTYINGVCYWLAHPCNHGQQEVILSFHMRDEVFEEVKVPYPHNNESYLPYIAAVDKESLHLITQNRFSGCYDIWVMRQQSCWTKQTTVGPFLNVYRTLRWWKNGSVFMETRRTHDVMLCDLNTQELRHIGFDESLKFWKWLFCYKESLLSIKWQGS